MSTKRADRRGFLRDAAAGALLAATPSTGLAGAPPPRGSDRRLDVANPRDVALIFRKLAFSLDAAPGYWWLKGRRYALIESRLIPLWDMHVGTAFRAASTADPDVYAVTLISVSFYTDLLTGDFIDTLVNPLTGRRVRVSYFPPRAATVRFNPAGQMDAGLPQAGLEGDGSVGPAWIEGDQVWVQGDHILWRDAAPGLPAVRVNDLTTYAGDLGQVADPGIASAAASQAFSDLNTWPAWLEMGDKAGSYYSRAFGRKVASYDRMPARFRELMADRHPELAKTPAWF
jgi:hypothetical protein